MKTPLEKLKADVDRAMARNMRWAVHHVREGRRPNGHFHTTPWKERSIADVAALKLVELAEAEKRASKLANRPAGMLGVVVIPQRIEDPGAWEAKAKALEADSRRVIDTTAGPALLTEGEKK